jgi:hypothetical protein
MEFEQELANLERHLRRILQEAAPELADFERTALQVLHLETHMMRAELLAQVGRSIPGNNPLMPN